MTKLVQRTGMSGIVGKLRETGGFGEISGQNHHLSPQKTAEHTVRYHDFFNSFTERSFELTEHDDRFTTLPLTFVSSPLIVLVNTMS